MSLVSLAGFAVATAAAVRSTSDDGDRPTAPSHEAGHGSHHHMAGGDGHADPAQIATIRADMARYRDVDTARAEGWRQELPDDPGLGAHFALSVDAEEASEAAAEDGSAAAPSEDGEDDAALDLAHPAYLMYSRIGRPDWQLVAVAYVVDQADFPQPPTDLRGAVYHQHVWNCVVDGEELDEEDVGTLTPRDCQARHGEWSPGGVWMTHVWLVDNPDGLFAETNPALV